jgi:hypothetical protein
VAVERASREGGWRWLGVGRGESAWAGGGQMGVLGVWMLKSGHRLSRRAGAAGTGVSIAEVRSQGWVLAEERGVHDPDKSCRKGEDDRRYCIEVSWTAHAIRSIASMNFGPRIAGFVRGVRGPASVPVASAGWKSALKTFI